MPSRAGSDNAPEAEHALILERHTDKWNSYSRSVQSVAILGLLLFAHTYLVFYQPAKIPVTNLEVFERRLLDVEQAIAKSDSIVREMTKRVNAVNLATSTVSQLGAPESAQIAFESVDTILRRSRRGNDQENSKTRKEAIELAIGIIKDKADETYSELESALGPDDLPRVNALKREWTKEIQSVRVDEAEDIDSRYFGRLLSGTFDQAASEAGFDDVVSELTAEKKSLAEELELKRKTAADLELELAPVRQGIASAESALNDVLPVWAKGVVSASSGVRFFASSLVIFVCVLAALSWRARVHFDYLRRARHLERLTRTNTLVSNVWTVVYRGPGGTLATIVAYGVVLAGITTLYEHSLELRSSAPAWIGRAILWGAGIILCVVIIKDYSHKQQVSPDSSSVRGTGDSAV